MLLTVMLLNFEVSQSSKEMFMQDLDKGEQSLWKVKVGMYNIDSWFQNMSQPCSEICLLGITEPN